NQYDFEEIKKRNELKVNVEYDIENNTLLALIKYQLIIHELKTYSGYEILAYNEYGDLISSKNGIGPLGRVDITQNQEYLYINTGGYVNEDQKFDRSFSIFHIPTKNILLTKTANENQCLS